MARHKFLLSSVVPAALKSRLLHLSKGEPRFTLLDGHHHQKTYSSFSWLCAWGTAHELNVSNNSFAALQAFHKKHQDWLLGHLHFDLKNEVENLASEHKDDFEFDHLSFYVPQHLVYLRQEQLWCESLSLQSESELLSILPSTLSAEKPTLPHFSKSLSANQYIQKIALLKEQLQYGTIYEINFCQALNATGPLATAEVFQQLNAIHQAPFSAFYKHGPRQLLCFSPERYLRKTGSTLISQPIKGTSKRGATSAEDQASKEALLASEKERAENVMIVDLVRNDLSRTAAPNSVTVPELFGLYSFNAVHQMISTVQSTLAPQYNFSDALATTFPMGSMTGAPKISALQLIDKHENFNRSLYSGSVGYITPNGDFDFNVIIRSILHHSQKQISSVRVGSAITIHCQAEQEYEECLLKAEKVVTIK
jgi:para-aminobenzoate synthetase component 1